MKQKRAPAAEWKSQVRAPAAPAPKPQEPTEPAPGLRCRRCGCGHFETLKTVPALRGRIMRRRECRHCGTRLTTYETPVAAETD